MRVHPQVNTGDRVARRVPLVRCAFLSRGQGREKVARRICLAPKNPLVAKVDEVRVSHDVYEDRLLECHYSIYLNLRALRQCRNLHAGSRRIGRL